MKRLILTLLFVFPLPSISKINVVVTYPYIKSIMEEIGKERVNITVLSKGSEDPHFVTPRPSFIGKIRKADIFIINGASLEIGFVPPLLRQANNSKVNPGGKGFLDLSNFVELIEKPAIVSRSEGDIHPEGNPHFYLDYHNLKPIAKAIYDMLFRIDPEGREYYKKNYEDFNLRLEKKIKEWDEKFQKLRGKRVIQYHKLYNYLIKRAGLQIFAEIEPKVGIPPTAKHTQEIIERAKGLKVDFIITDVYHPQSAVEEIGKKINVKFKVLPHDVNAMENVRNIFELFDKIVEVFNE